MASIFDYMASSSTMGLARQLVDLRRERDRLMLRSLEQYSLPPEGREDLRKERLALEARIEAVEASVLANSPATLAEVAVQLMTALQHVDGLASHRGEGARDVREAARILERVMVSAVRRIEAQEGVDLAKLGSSFYLKGRATAENYEHLWADIAAGNFREMAHAFREVGEEHLVVIPSEPSVDVANPVRVDVRRHPARAAADWQVQVLDLWRSHPWPRPGFLDDLKNRGWLERCVFLASEGAGRPLAFQFIGTPTIKVFGTDWARSQLGRPHLADPHTDYACDIGEQYQEAIEARKPIYNRLRITGLPGRPVDYSHLLLGWTLPDGRQALLACIDHPA